MYRCDATFCHKSRSIAFDENSPKHRKKPCYPSPNQWHRHTIFDKIEALQLEKNPIAISPHCPMSPTSTKHPNWAPFFQKTPRCSACNIEQHHQLNPDCDSNQPKPLSFDTACLAVVPLQSAYDWEKHLGHECDWQIRMPRLLLPRNYFFVSVDRRLP